MRTRGLRSPRALPLVSLCGGAENWRVGGETTEARRIKTRFHHRVVFHHFFRFAPVHTLENRYGIIGAILKNSCDENSARFAVVLIVSLLFHPHRMVEFAVKI